MSKIDLRNADCLEVLKTLPDNSIDIIFTDPPYALGSEVVILPSGKPEYKKAVDFMGKWEQPTGVFWESWFKEANRVLKFGGRVLMFGLDRQLFLYKYFACFAGFTETQSLYWYFCNNFPKSADLSKLVDKHFGESREVFDNPKSKQQTSQDNTNSLGNKNAVTHISPIAVNEVAKKYSGYRYSISALKQSVEVIMVFQKPYKTGSCLHDTLALESGDNSITCGAMNINDNKVGTESTIRVKPNVSKKANRNAYHDIKEIAQTGSDDGRYPSQSFCDNYVADCLDKQSGLLISGAKRVTDKINSPLDDNGNYQSPNGVYGKFKPMKVDIPSTKGGCSKIMEKCDYDSVDFDLYMYCPKVSKKERNMGNVVNNHPTLKPISLIKKILALFKTPNQQTIMDCFMGSGSIGIACKQKGFNFIGIELDADYFCIAQNRINKTTLNIQNKLL